MKSDSLSLVQARRLALRAQGLHRAGIDRASDNGKSWRSLRSSLDVMSALQIDAINTIVRSHYMPLYSRFGAYDRALLDAHVFAPGGQVRSRRTHYEYWGHECSVLPLELYPLFAWRRDDARNGVGVYRQLAELARKHGDHIESVRQRVQAAGASTSRDVSITQRGPGMWEWNLCKRSLEYLFWTGELVSAGRHNFERRYDTPERAIPDRILAAPVPDRRSAQSLLMLRAARALGVATETDLRDYFRFGADDSKAALQRLCESGQLREVSVEGWNKAAYVLPECVIPRQLTGATLLTPFDPLVWRRDRAQRLFGFHYRIEIYVPEAQREYGYYVLPFLLDEQLVARVDLKTDRERGTLTVLGAWCEAGIPDKQRRHVALALSKELQALALWLCGGRVVLGRRGDMMSDLRRARSRASTQSIVETTS